MRYINVKTTDGGRLMPVYDIREDAAILNNYLYSPIVRKSVRDRRRLLNIPAAFDIETTNVIYTEAERKEGKRPYAYMYHWQFCIGDPGNDQHAVFFGRTWEEFQLLILELDRRLDLRGQYYLPVYVHNLAFEFQFMRRFFQWSDVFLKGPRNPLKATADGIIEFRDSYALSNMSLAKWCENTPEVIFSKNDGEKFDYKKVRRPWDQLTEEEESYCYCDVAGLCECLAYLMREDNLATIPLTNTGYVRRDFRKAYQENPKLRDAWQRDRLTPEQFQICREAFRGGNTHANYYYVGARVEDVQSFDLSSSYPGAMLLDQYPVSGFTEIKPKTWLRKKWMPDHAALIHVTFENIQYIGECGIPYIPIYKCKCSADRVNDNGRVWKCSAASMWITDIDLYIIEKDYTWSRRWVDRVLVSRYGPLPDEHKQKVMDYFRAKTELKNVEGREYEYGKAKNRLNSSYGMMVTNIAKALWEYKGGDFVKSEKTLQKILDDFYKSQANFLRYEQGVWVTANARRRLQEMLWVVGKDVLYVDTDSIKCIGDHRAEFAEANKAIIERCEAAGYYADDPKGRRHFTGAWEYEETYRNFKTLGAKRYMVEDQAGKIHTTIAGVAKKAGAAYFQQHGFDAFDDGVVIANAGHVVAYYNDDEKHTITIDGREIVTGSNVALADERYTLGLTGDYIDLLQHYVDNIGQFGV